MSLDLLLGATLRRISAAISERIERKKTFRSFLFL